MGFSRHEYWSGFCHFLLQGLFPIQGSNRVSRFVDRCFTVWATNTYKSQQTNMNLLSICPRLHSINLSIFCSHDYLSSFSIYITLLLFWYLLYSCSEKAMAPHSSTLAWKIPWTEEPGRLQSMRSLRVGHDWVTSLSLFTFLHWRRKWQPTPVFLPGESQGWGSLVGCRLWGHTESDTTKAT